MENNIVQILHGKFYVIDDILIKLEREEIRLASIKQRTLAYMIDDILLSLLLIVALWEQFGTIQNAEQLIEFVNRITLALFLLKFVYHTLFTALYGATLGKIFLKIRIISLDTYDNLSWGMAAMRSLGRIISESLFYLGFLWAITDSLKQGWHDKMGKCIVINA